MNKILVMSDLHLRETIKTAGTILTGDCRLAIEQLKTLCNLIKPDIAIMAGDIFDKRNVSPEDLNLFKLVIEAIGVKENRIFTIQGNHDRGGDTPIPKSFGCQCLSPEGPMTTLLSVEGVLSLWGRSYDPDIFKDKITGQRDAAINILHHPCRPFNNRVETALEVKDMLTNCMTIIGDTHTAELITAKGGRLILSPGAFFPQNKTELCSFNSTGIWLINVEDGKIKEENIVQLPFLARRGMDLIAATDKSDIERSMNYFMKKVQGELESLGLDIKPLPPVFYINDKAPDVNPPGDCIIVRVAEGVELTPISESLETVSATSMDAIPTLVKQIIEKEGVATEAASLIMDMWNTSDPYQVIAAYIKKKGVPLRVPENN